MENWSAIRYLNLMSTFFFPHLQTILDCNFKQEDYFFQIQSWLSDSHLKLVSQTFQKYIIRKDKIGSFINIVPYLDF